MWCNSEYFPKEIQEKNNLLYATPLLISEFIWSWISTNKVIDQRQAHQETDNNEILEFPL